MWWLTLFVLAATGSAASTAGPRIDPLFVSQWHHQQVRTPAAWEVTRGAGQVIAIHDFGVDLDHPDLVANLIGGVTNPRTGEGDGSWEEVDYSPSHGTNVASIAAAAANGYGGIGVAPEASILSVGANPAQFRDAVQWARRNGATVFNIAVSEGLVASGVVALTIRESITDEADDLVVVVAAGNDSIGDALCVIPHPNVVCVTATDRFELPAAYSSLGYNPQGHTVAAPGGSLGGSASLLWPAAVCPLEMVVAKPVGTGLREDGNCPLSTEDMGYGLGIGTSFAAPIVSGIAALVRSLGCDAPTTIEIITSTARPPVGVAEGLLPYYGHGIVDAEAAVEVAAKRCSQPQS